MQSAATPVFRVVFVFKIRISTELRVGVCTRMTTFQYIFTPLISISILRRKFNGFEDFEKTDGKTVPPAILLVINLVS